MRFADVRIGQIVCIGQSSTYGLVVGLLNDCSRLDRLYRGFWDSVYVAFMPFGKFTLTERTQGVEETESFKSFLRDCARKLFSHPLEFENYGYGVTVDKLRAIDTKPLTKEVRNWMLKTNMVQSKKEQQEMAASILTKAKEEEFISLYQDISNYIKRIQDGLKNLRSYHGEKIKKGTILVEDNNKILLFYTDDAYVTCKFALDMESNSEYWSLFIISSKYDYQSGKIDDSFFTRNFCIIDVNVFDCKANTELYKKYLVETKKGTR